LKNHKIKHQLSINYEKLLQGQYEAESLPPNFATKHAVPDFAYNVLNPLGLIYRPVVDEHFLKNGGKKPIWPGNKPFAVCLTHDVDFVSLHSLKNFTRSRLSELTNSDKIFLKVKSLMGLGLDLGRMVKNFGITDPLFCYERWLEKEREIEGHSTFFFWPGLKSITKPHHTDCLYELHDRIIFDNQGCTVAEMIKEIDKLGWDIGLHPSWHSFNNLDELKRQKDALTVVLGHEPTSIRQHYLHYDCRITPTIQAEAGFKYDSTLGYNDNVGFRRGTCYPYQLYDLKAEKKLQIIEIPLIIQDGAMLNQGRGMRLDLDTAFQYIILLTEQVAKCGGVLTLLWHPSYIINPCWWGLYGKALKYLQQKNAWFASVQEIGDWWDDGCHENNCGF